MKSRILLIDSECVVCNGFVQFVIQHDRRETIFFASLQSEVGQQLLRQYDLPADAIFTAVFIEGDRAFTRSDAILQVLQGLSGLWSVVGWLRALPRPFRNFCYDWFAARRYHWFGHTDACLLPSPDLRKRLL